MALMTSFFELKEIKILLIPLIIIISISQFSILKKIEKVTLKNLQPSFDLTDINIPTYNIVGNDFSDGLKFCGKNSKYQESFYYLIRRFNEKWNKV